MRWIEINEAREAPLYHFMDVKKAIDVLLHDAMPANWTHYINDQPVKGNSFTRNPRFEIGGRPVRLIMNQHALAARHKIIPLDGEITFRHPKNDEVGYVSADPWPPKKLHGFKDRVINSRKPGEDRALQEEFVVGDIAPLARMIVEIEILKPNFYHMSGQQASDLLDLVRNYGTEHNVATKIHPDFIEQVNDIREMWREED